LLNETFLLDYRQFPGIYVSQGSVATLLRCGEIFNDCIITYASVAESAGKILKIGQHLANLWTRVWCPDSPPLSVISLVWTESTSIGRNQWLGD